MKFEKVIARISATVAGIVVFLFASGMYLSFKGFVFEKNGNITLISNANAKSTDAIKIASNIALPTGKVLGDPNAPATLYEFSSLTCFHCAIFHNNEIPKIKKEFIDTGKLKLVFVNFPLDKASMQGALVADCLPKDKYFGFINKLFENQKKWGFSKTPAQYLTDYAKLEGLSEDKIKTCLTNQKQAQEILAIRQDSMNNLKIMGTPSFLVVKGNERLLFQGGVSVKKLSEILSKN